MTGLLLGLSRLWFVGRSVSSQWSAGATYLRPNASPRTPSLYNLFPDACVRALHATQTFDCLPVSSFVAVEAGSWERSKAVEQRRWRHAGERVGGNKQSTCTRDILWMSWCMCEAVNAAVVANGGRRW